MHTILCSLCACVWVYVLVFNNEQPPCFVTRIRLHHSYHGVAMTVAAAGGVLLKAIWRTHTHTPLDYVHPSGRMYADVGSDWWSRYHNNSARLPSSCYVYFSPFAFYTFGCACNVHGTRTRSDGHGQFKSKYGSFVLICCRRLTIFVLDIYMRTTYRLYMYVCV